MKFNYVRIVALFILLVSVGVFTSCSSLNDTDGDNTDTVYVGNWKLVKATFTGEVADPSEFAGFSLALNSEGTYVLTNPTAFSSPTGVAGTYTSTGQFLIFDGNVEINVTSIDGNTMVWEWQVSKPGKITATYRYTFEKI
ncbi:hypothetical protein ACE193_10115 [Bernardetia sp. OM2101]|uniref:hypothetical protein n=1 Tax=Bernardetia sp. OM2101 TaxID=3344876 RepID=UPI0035D0081C